VKFIKVLDEISESDLPFVGGKGLNLGLMTQAGFSVPDGFCVTTQAHKTAITSISSSIAEISEDAIAEILEAYEKIGKGKVAVRSSATAEDLPEASFAGQQDTFLNVEGSEELIQSIQNCWASLWSERAVTYRHLKGLDEDQISMAVVVQKMSSGNRTNKTIEEGMDETCASLTGVIPRTQFFDDSQRSFVGEIKFSAAGDDLVGGITASDSFQTVDQLKTLMPMLDRRLNHAVAKLRHFMGTDQEIEFTVEDGVLSILQSRSAEIGTDQELLAFAEVGAEATRGTGTRGGAFRGMVAFDEADWKELTDGKLRGRTDVDGVLLVMENPTPDDIPLIMTMDGLLAARGGSSSHAAVAINIIEDKSFSAVMSAIGLRVDANNHEAMIVDEQSQGCWLKSPQSGIVSIPHRGYRQRP